MKDILSDVVKDATGETAVKEHVAGVLSEIVNEAVCEKQTQEKAKSETAADVKETLSEAVDDTEKDVNDILSGIVDQTTKTVVENEVKAVLNEIVDGSTTNTHETESKAAEKVSELKVASEKNAETEEEVSETKNNIVDDNSTNTEIISTEIEEKSGGKVSDDSELTESATTVEVSNESQESVSNETIEKNTSDTQATLTAVVYTLNDIIDNAAAAGIIQHVFSFPYLIYCLFKTGDSNPVEKPTSKTSTRSSSKCSGRFDVEERVIPGAISRPRTPENI